MKNLHLMRPALSAVAALSFVSVTACSEEPNAGEQTSLEPSDDTLAEALSDTDDLSTVAKALGDSGLVQVFDGAGSYTIFAPNNGAFENLGEAGTGLRDPAQGAAMAAVLRDHIVPGYLTPTDIETALEAQSGRVKVETMGGHMLTFTRDGEDIRVTSEDGSTALLTGNAVMASNGVAISLDGVLKKVDAPA